MESSTDNDTRSRHLAYAPQLRPRGEEKITSYRDFKNVRVSNGERELISLIEGFKGSGV